MYNQIPTFQKHLFDMYNLSQIGMLKSMWYGDAFKYVSHKGSLSIGDGPTYVGAINRVKITGSTTISSEVIRNIDQNTLIIPHTLALFKPFTWYLGEAMSQLGSGITTGGACMVWQESIGQLLRYTPGGVYVSMFNTAYNNSPLQIQGDSEPDSQWKHYPLVNTKGHWPQVASDVAIASRKIRDQESRDGFGVYAFAKHTAQYIVRNKTELLDKYGLPDAYSHMAAVGSEDCRYISELFKYIQLPVVPDPMMIIIRDFYVQGMYMGNAYIKAFLPQIDGQQKNFYLRKGNDIILLPFAFTLSNRLEGTIIDIKLSTKKFALVKVKYNGANIPLYQMPAYLADNEMFGEVCGWWNHDSTIMNPVRLPNSYVDKYKTTSYDKNGKPILTISGNSDLVGIPISDKRSGAEFRDCIISAGMLRACNKTYLSDYAEKSFAMPYAVAWSALGQMCLTDISDMSGGGVFGWRTFYKSFKYDARNTGNTYLADPKIRGFKSYLTSISNGFEELLSIHVKKAEETKDVVYTKLFKSNLISGIR